MSTTTNVNISMPQVIRDVMEQRMAEKGFENISEYIRDLIRNDYKRAAQEKLDAELLESEQSGELITIDKEWWERKKADLRERLRKAKQA
jgi:antitoxin ParD1/3/4